VAADAYKPRRPADPKALADAIRATNITDNVSIGPGIQFDATGQNAKVKDGAIQNRGASGNVGAERGGQCQAGMAVDVVSEPHLSQNQCRSMSI